MSKLQEVCIRSVTGIFLVLSFWFIITQCSPIIFSLLLAGCCLYILLYEWPQIAPRNWWCISLFYPVMSFVLLIMLNQSLQYHSLILPLFVIVALHDTASYIVGSLIGTHLIAPRISPKKTWEGAAGGLISLIIFLSVINFSINRMSLYTILYHAFFLSLCALTGDLFESWLKRRVGVKDTGIILPGHGGLLDRFDSILFVIIYWYAYKDQFIAVFEFGR